MEKKIIQIPTNKAKIYKQILSVMNFLFDATNQEQDVLAELIMLNKEYEALDEDKRAKFILSTDMRKEIRSRIDVGEKQFNGLISRLKSKKTFNGAPFISEKGILNPSLLMYPDKEGFELTLSLKLTEEVKKATKEETTDKEEIVEQRIAKPANGTDNIINEGVEEEITLL